MKTQWHYFTLVAGEGDVFTLEDEEGQPLTDDDSLLLFASHEEAETYLKEHNIRGTVR